jgi:hypothetical protein
MRSHRALGIWACKLQAGVLAGLSALRGRAGGAAAAARGAQAACCETPLPADARAAVETLLLDLALLGLPADPALIEQTVRAALTRPAGGGAGARGAGTAAPLPEPAPQKPVTSTPGATLR